MNIIDEYGKWELKNGTVELIQPAKQIDETKLEELKVKKKKAYKQEVLLKLEASDKQLIRLVDELSDFCETLGFIPNITKKELMQERKALRQELQGL